jgi:hypothetical protein
MCIFGVFGVCQSGLVICLLYPEGNKNRTEAEIFASAQYGKVNDREVVL